MSRWGEHYAEFSSGILGELDAFLSISVRNDTKAIFFYARNIGFAEVRQIETLEFDGWELFLDGIDTEPEVHRLESVQAARSKLTAFFLDRIEHARELGELSD